MKPIPIDEKQTVASYKRNISLYCDELYFIAHQHGCKSSDKKNYMESVVSIRSFLSQNQDIEFCESTARELNKTVSIINKHERDLKIVYTPKEQRTSSFIAKIRKFASPDNPLVQYIIENINTIDALLYNLPCDHAKKKKISEQFSINEDWSKDSKRVFLVSILDNFTYVYNLKYRQKMQSPEAKEDLEFIKKFIFLVNQATKINPTYAKEEKDQRMRYIKVFKKCITSEFKVVISDNELTLRCIPVILPCTNFLEMPKEWDGLNQEIVCCIRQKVPRTHTIQIALENTLQALKMGVQVFQGDFDWLLDIIAIEENENPNNANIILTKFMASLCANRQDLEILSTSDYVTKYNKEQLKNNLCKGIVCAALVMG